MLLLGKEEERSYSTKVMGNLERSQTPESKSKDTPMGFSWKGELGAQRATKNKAETKDGKAHYYSKCICPWDTISNRTSGSLLE